MSPESDERPMQIAKKRSGGCSKDTLSQIISLAFLWLNSNYRTNYTHIFDTFFHNNTQ